MILKAYRYVVNFMELAKTETGYAVNNVQDSVVIESLKKLTLTTIHNLTRREYVEKYGRDPRYLSIMQIEETVTNKDYQEVK
nr:MAG TPA: hypothetical protein [Caudoviricetes sp.]